MKRLKKREYTVRYMLQGVTKTKKIDNLPDARKFAQQVRKEGKFLDLTNSNRVKLPI